MCTLDTSSSINGITTLTFKDKLSQFSRKIKKDPNSFWQSIRDSPKILKYYFPNNEWVTFSHFSSSERKKIKRKKTSDILSGFFCVFLHTILRWLDGHWSIFSIDKESCKKKKYFYRKLTGGSFQIWNCAIHRRNGTISFSSLFLECRQNLWVANEDEITISIDWARELLSIFRLT